MYFKKLRSALLSLILFTTLLWTLYVYPKTTTVPSPSLYSNIQNNSLTNALINTSSTTSPPKVPQDFPPLVILEEGTPLTPEATIYVSPQTTPHQTIEHEEVEHSTSQLACRVPNITYDHETVLKIFPELSFPECPVRNVGWLEETESGDAYLHLNPNCNNNATWYSWYEDGAKTPKWMLKGERWNRWANKSSPIRLPSKDSLAGVWCKDVGFQYMERVVFQQDVYKRAHEKFYGTDPEESVSRGQFYRKLNETAAYIDSLRDDITSAHKLFHLRAHNILGDNTPPNMTPFITGKSLGEFVKPPIKFCCGNVRITLPNWTSAKFLWNYMEEAGYVTLLGDEECSSWIDRQNKLGKTKKENTPTDHYFQKLYCITSGYDAHSSKRRCVGDHDSHWHMLNYLKSFVKKYNGVPRWSMNHFMAGHETTGSIVKTLDSDLKECIAELLKDNNTLIFIMGDHGMRYGEWRKNKAGVLEHKIPMLATLFPKWFLELHPDVEANLQWNEDKLVTKFDLHHTIKHLALFPDRPREVPHGSYSILDPIPASRTCEDARVPAEYCSCLPWVNIPADSSHVALAHRTVNEINKKIYNFTSFCMTLQLKTILEVQKQVLKQEEGKYDINYQDGNEWEVVANFKKGWKETMKVPESQGYPTIKAGIIRLSSYGLDRECESKALSSGAKPEFCVCNPIPTAPLIPQQQTQQQQTQQSQQLSDPAQTVELQSGSQDLSESS